MSKASGDIGRRRMLGLALASAVAAVALGAAAQASAAPVDLAVIDSDSGRPLTLWPSQGRQFLAGAPGARYSLRLTNNTPGRVLAVVSVDGVNVISGETASYDQEGYILGPYQSYEVTGWRKSLSQVAAFNFTALSNSYAAQTGRPSDVGVIGMAVFNERTPPRPPAAIAVPLPAPPMSSRSGAGRGGPGPAIQPRAAPQSADTGGQGARATLSLVDGQRSASAEAAGSPVQRLNKDDLAKAGAGRAGEPLGTGHGAIEQSVITMQPFVRASASPMLLTQIQYDSYANLRAKGVIPAPPPPPRAPQAFPGQGFVPDPPR